MGQLTDNIVMTLPQRRR